MSILSMKNVLFQGVFAALVTPFHKDLSIDWDSFEKYVDWLCTQGIQGVVPCGTTGEGSALTFEEQGLLIHRCVQVVNKRAKVIAGTSALTVAATVALVTQAQQKGADGALIVTPPYIRPSQKGLIQYYQDIHDQTDLPIVLYHNPGRAAVSLEVSTIQHLAELPRIVGLKDSCTDLTRPITLSSLCDFSLLSGEDGTFLPFLAAGGDGIISVGAGLAPIAYKKLWESWLRKDTKNCLAIAQKLIALSQILFQSSNPGPVKYACHLMGWSQSLCRYPLGPLDPKLQENLAQCLHQLSLLE
jgi:4-hydroxy-tetrahydrodipicolinate synthase